MSTKHVRTASDLARFDCGLKVECRSCGNAVTVDGFALARTCGSGDLVQIQKRLKCSRCGEKSARLTVLPPMPKRG
jgi:hypothetical protein